MSVTKKGFIDENKIPEEIRKEINKKSFESISVEQLISLIRPAIGFDIKESKDEISVGTSKFGGKPDLPKSVNWPMADDEYLPFIAQINLSEVKDLDLENLLPKEGMLYFFSDTQPDEIYDYEILYSKNTKELVQKDYPEELELRKDEDDFVAILPEYPMEFSQSFTFPSEEFVSNRVKLTDEDKSKMYELLEFIEDFYMSSRLLGWPNTLQGEIVEDENRIVLLQLSGDTLSVKSVYEDVFEHWCGCGIIHALIYKEKLLKKEFNDVEMFMNYT